MRFMGSQRVRHDWATELNLIPKGSKKEQTKPKISRRKEIMEIRAELSEIRLKIREKISETKIWFFEKIHKINKPLGRLSMRKREMIQISKIRNVKEVTINITEI